MIQLIADELPDFFAALRSKSPAARPEQLTSVDPVSDSGRKECGLLPSVDTSQSMPGVALIEISKRHTQALSVGRPAQPPYGTGGYKTL
jgi:hypothetical protein